MEDRVDRFEGALLGVALGDAIGAPHEGGLIGGAIWAALGVGKGDLLRTTDDTRMTIGLAESLLECGGLDADHVARRWADGFDRLRGYGPGAARLLRMIRDGRDWREANRAVFPDGSFGNGGAMRATPIGLFYHGDPAALVEAARLAASITHAHPLGIEGAVLIARAVALALGEPLDGPAFVAALASPTDAPEYRDRLAAARELLTGGRPDRRRVRRDLGCGVLAHESVVTAIYTVCAHPGKFERMMDFIISLGGDTDTIGAMAGGIFGARHGRGDLPGAALARLEDRDRIAGLGRSLHDRIARPI